MLLSKLIAHRPARLSAGRTGSTSSQLLPCGLPSHLANESSPSLYEFAWFANQAYADESKIQRPPTRGGLDWNFLPEHSLSNPKHGVHLQTWQNGENAVVCARGTTFDEIAHVMGNIALLLDPHTPRNGANVPGRLEEAAISGILQQWGLLGDDFAGADLAAEHVSQVVHGYSKRGVKVWLCGHSRGAALMAHAGLMCSDDLAGIISFESPGLPASHVQKYRPACYDKFVQYNTFPNYVTLLHPAVNKTLRYHIPVCGPREAITWEFTRDCLLADANRALNWVFAARSFASILQGPSAAIQAIQDLMGNNVVVALSCLAKGNSFGLSMEYFRMTHGISNILDCLSYSGAGRNIRPILKWPSDVNSLGGINLLGQSLLDCVENELLFNQPHQLGCHHLLHSKGHRDLHQARLHRLWSSQWKLGDPECVVSDGARISIGAKI